MGAVQAKGLVQSRCRPSAPVFGTLETFALGCELESISPRTMDHALHSDKAQSEVTGRVVHFHKGRSNLFSPNVQLGDRIAIEALMCGFVPGLIVVPCSGEVPGSPALLCGE